MNQKFDSIYRDYFSRKSFKKIQCIEIKFANIIIYKPNLGECQKLLCLILNEINNNNNNQNYLIVNYNNSVVKRNCTLKI